LAQIANKFEVNFPAFSEPKPHFAHDLSTF